MFQPETNKIASNVSEICWPLLIWDTFLVCTCVLYTRQYIGINLHIIVETLFHLWCRVYCFRSIGALYPVVQQLKLDMTHVLMQITMALNCFRPWIGFKMITITAICIAIICWVNSLREELLVEHIVCELSLNPITHTRIYLQPDLHKIGSIAVVYLKYIEIINKMFFPCQLCLFLHI